MFSLDMLSFFWSSFQSDGDNRGEQVDDIEQRSREKTLHTFPTSGALDRPQVIDKGEMRSIGKKMIISNLRSFHSYKSFVW